MTFDLRCHYSSRLRLAVTGATGFIGRAVVGDPSHGFTTCGFADVPDDSVIVHLAAVVASKRSDAAINVSIDLWVFEEVQRRHAALVYASTNNVYPFAVDCRTDGETRCNDFYSASKVFGERLIFDALSKPFSIVRIADVFGKGQRHGNLFRAMEKAIRAREPLHKIGLGLKRRSYIYAPELASLLLDVAIRLRRGETVPLCINACYPDSLSVGELVEMVGRMADLPVDQIEVRDTEIGAWADIRTMRPGPFGAYKLRWPTLQAALASYIQDVNTRE